MFHASFFVMRNKIHAFFDLMLKCGNEQCNTRTFGHVWRRNNFNMAQWFDGFETNTKNIAFKDKFKIEGVLRVGTNLFTVLRWSRFSVNTKCRL